MVQDLIGKLFVVMFGIGDLRFVCLVILICVYSDDYMMGLVFNKLIDDFILLEFLIQLDIEQDIMVLEIYVFNGGFVGMDCGFVVYINDYYSENVIVEVVSDFLMIVICDVLCVFVIEGVLMYVIMMLGYLGWGFG